MYILIKKNYVKIFVQQYIFQLKKKQEVLF